LDYGPWTRGVQETSLGPFAIRRQFPDILETTNAYSLSNSPDAKGRGFFD